ncbi:MAG TPA: DUF3140 domain-containing protein [Solirubrobacteraceae bacterium]|nr:DUF3140 domain-containing protein [Solirubrobacteraceae bacterium]
MADDDPDETRRAFGDAVNMTPKELEGWLETDESQSVGQKDGGGESVGHESGRRIVALLRTKKDDLTDDDLAHMRKVTGYVHRHLAQGGPDDDAEHSRWRSSLMNWGHDPLKT